MTKSYAILIDGGFVKRKLGTARVPMDSVVLNRFVQALQELPELRPHSLHRIYYYDAEPSADVVKKPLSEEILDFGKTDSFGRNRKLFAELVRLPYFALRMGEVVFNGWRIPPKTLSVKQESITLQADDFKPVVNQKGVDMRIGLDIASLTLKRQASIIVLVTGDSDFVPAMKFARKEGAQLYLVPLNHGIREAMYEHADLVLHLSKEA